MKEIGMRKDELDTPALWVDLNGLEENVKLLAAIFARAGVDWRPHIKAIRIPAIAQMAVRAGAIGVTCAKLTEAEFMSAGGITDVLIANQIVGPYKVNRLAHLCRRVDVKVAVDNPGNVNALCAAAQACGVTLAVVIEVNVGLDRAGVAPGEPCRHLARLISHSSGLKLKGVMGWEGHTRKIEDFEERRGAIEQAVMALTQTASMLRADGHDVAIVSCGGTGTHYVSAFMPGVTEVQTGGAIFGDGFAIKQGEHTTPCLFVRSTVTSRPAPNRVIIDAGFKALPPTQPPARPIGLEGVEKSNFSAEHGEITLSSPDDSLRVGDSIDVMVGYSDMTVMNHDKLYGVRDGLVEVVWNIEGRGCYR